MRVRVQRATTAAGFDLAKMKADRPIVLDDQDLPRRGSGFFWPRRAMMLSRIPGQAHVVAWARWTDGGASWARPVWPLG